MQWFVSSMNEDVHTEVNIFMYYLLFIQMLVVFSLQLILKLEVQRASRWEDKMGIWWEEQGLGAATIVSWAPWALSITSACSNCLCPWCCGVDVCLQSQGQTHIFPRRSQSSWRIQGKAECCLPSHSITPRDKTGSVTTCSPYKMAAASLLLQVSPQKSLFSTPVRNRKESWLIMKLPHANILSSLS